uniref:Uncharacterized protein n=1 Tax=Calidris pygmaea TaxID=425635 RepID=A0A8C3JQ45_9CHAR
ANSRSSPRSCAARGCRHQSPSLPASSSPAEAPEGEGDAQRRLQPAPCSPQRPTGSLSPAATPGLLAAACCTCSMTARSAGPNPSPAAMPALHIPGRPRRLHFRLQNTHSPPPPPLLTSPKYDTWKTKQC